MFTARNWPQPSGQLRVLAHWVGPMDRTPMIGERTGTRRYRTRSAHTWEPPLPLESRPSDAAAAPASISVGDGRARRAADATGVYAAGGAAPPERELASQPLGWARHTCARPCTSWRPSTGRAAPPAGAPSSPSRPRRSRAVRPAWHRCDVTLDDLHRVRLIVGETHRIAGRRRVAASPSTVQLEGRTGATRRSTPTPNAPSELDVGSHAAGASRAQPAAGWPSNTMTSRWTESVRRHSHATRRATACRWRRPRADLPGGGGPDAEAPPTRRTAPQATRGGTREGSPAAQLSSECRAVRSDHSPLKSAPTLLHALSRLQRLAI